jgi:hypothetical protein
MGTRWAYVQSVAASAKDTGTKVEAAASAVTLVGTGLAWWRYGVAWGLVVFLTSFLLVVIRAGLRQQRAIEQLSDSATPLPIQPRYDHGSQTYHHPMDGQPGVIEHRVGLFNPGIETVHGVRMALLGMEPWPRHILNNMDPVTPYAVPMLSRGEESVGVSLAPGRGELWILGYTGTGSDAHMNAGGWAVRDQHWRGMPWTADADVECSRFSGQDV